MTNKKSPVIIQCEIIGDFLCENLTLHFKAEAIVLKHIYLFISFFTCLF